MHLEYILYCTANIYIIPVTISQNKMLRVMVRDKTFFSVPKWGVMLSFYREIRFYPWPPGGQTLDFIETLCSQICVYKMIDCDSLTFMF